MNRPDRKYKNTICIYCLENQENGKRYIGKTKDLYNRIRHYFYDFKHQRNDHINDHLLNAFNKYGLESFEWWIVESFDKLNNDLMKEREKEYIEVYNTLDKEKGYNLRRDSKTQMITHEETSKKISKRLEKEWEEGIRDGHGEKLSKWWENNPEEKERQAEILRENITKYKYRVWKNSEYLGEFLYNELENIEDIIPSSVCGAFHRKEKNPVDYKQFTIERIEHKI